jgi:hypothetical protein
MSKIEKVAVTDARLVQDEPVYAVQKGALSVSVAPFQAISASASQMTFQVLVPSLNVFIDRKIVLSSNLSFNANLFYSGPRGAANKTTIFCGQTAGAAISTNSVTTATALLNNVAITTGQVTTFNSAISASTPFTVSGIGFAPGTTVTTFAYTSDGVIVLTLSAPLLVAIPASQTYFVIQFPAIFDVPDPQEGASFGAGQSMGTDDGMGLSLGGQPGAQSGWCSAVSGKDLAWTQFPLQSSLVNMTATLNDCTVTTNGDTLREQLMLTSSQPTLKQRTTPTCADVFSWGKDDAQNNCGNFSTYSVSNNYGDIPNGAWPTQWNSDPTCSTGTLLTSNTIAQCTDANGTTTNWPFYPAGKVFNFLPSSVNSGSAQKGGIGFYTATTSYTGSALTGYGNQTVLVPFLNYQPVWTTGFPGGDLSGSLLASISNTTIPGLQQFTIDNVLAPTLTLNVAVPPMCMVGARLYDLWFNDISVVAAPVGGAAQTSAGGVLAIVTGLKSGSLGAPGSKYQLTFASGLVVGPQSTTTTVLGQLGRATGFGGANAGGSLGLSAGCPVELPLPVFGTISVVEPMVISPLIWADSAEYQSVGLYGMTNMQFVLNFSTLGTCKAIANSQVSTKLTDRQVASNPLWIDDLTQPNPNTGNILRSSNIRSTLSDLKFAATSGQNGPWGGGDASALSGTQTGNPTMFATFLTPGVDVTIPDVSTVPYVEFPRYFYSIGGPIVAGMNSITSQTISLTSIPDMVMVYVKPGTRGASQLDQYLPINGVSVTFDNFSNLCSSYKQAHLYESAVAAGLDMDWHQWRGYTQAQYPSTILNSAAPYAPVGMSPFTQTTGGPILLRMGQDITLQPGLAPGCLGNYSFQITVQVDNSKGYYSYVQTPVITIIAINTGFFETMRGQSAIRKTILQMADVAAATTDSGVSKTHLNRMVGTGSYFKSASNLIHTGLAAAKKAKEINDRHHITSMARTYGGEHGSRLADMAESAMSSGAQAHDSLYGHGHKRHRSSGL